MTLSANITDLRYIYNKFFYQGVTTDNTIKIDDVNFYNNQTSATTLTTNWNFTDVYPNLPNGTIFEESDTGIHYMFDGSSTWNMMDQLAKEKVVYQNNLFQDNVFQDNTWGEYAFQRNVFQ